MQFKNRTMFVVFVAFILYEMLLITQSVLLIRSEVLFTIFNYIFKLFSLNISFKGANNMSGVIANCYILSCLKSFVRFYESTLNRNISVSI